MGVINNQIKIAGIEAATAGIMTSVASMKLDLDDLTTVTEVTATPQEKVTIGATNIYKSGNVVSGYVRFTVASDHPGTSDYTMFKLSESPRAIVRMSVFSEWDAAKTGEIAIDTSGNVKAGSTSIVKGQLYGAYITFISKEGE